MTASLPVVYPFTGENFEIALGGEEVSKGRIPEYLFRYLEELKASTIVVEPEYIDADYLEDFAAYYVRCFQDYSRWCKRLHFFTQDITESQFDQVLRGEVSSESLRDSYIGFIVIRPLPGAPIGRTVLGVYDTDNNRRHYQCTRVYKANLFGIALEVGSLAFQQQDSIVAACATVALWCGFQKTSELFAGAMAPRPAQITSAAGSTGVTSRVFPNSGLEVRHICDAIRFSGLEPEVFNVDRSTYLPSLLYGHLAHGVPPILGVEIENRGLHAITVSGYSLRDSVSINRECGETSPVPMIGRRIDEFYVHDDQVGPFARLRVVEEATSGTYPVTFTGTWTDEASGKELRLLPRVVIVPIYHKVRVSFVEIQSWILRFHKILEAVTTDASTMEWDVCLVDVNSYRENVLNNDKRLPEARKAIALRKHPRFIWKANLRQNGTTILQFLADATGLKHSFPMYCLSWFDDGARRQFSADLWTLDEGILREYLGHEFLEFLRS